MLLRSIVKRVDDILCAMRHELSIAARPCGQHWIFFIAGPVEAIGRESNPHAAIVARLVFANSGGLPVGHLKTAGWIRRGGPSSITLAPKQCDVSHTDCGLRHEMPS